MFSGPPRGVGEDPRASQLARGALRLERAFDTRQHVDIAHGGHGLHGSLALSRARLPDTDQLAVPVERVPPEPDLFPWAQAGEEGDGKVAAEHLVRQTDPEELPHLVEREGQDLRLVLPEPGDLTRGILLKPPALDGAIQRLAEHLEDDVHAPVGQLPPAAPPDCLDRGALEVRQERVDHSSGISETRTAPDRGISRPSTIECQS
jgi:hypothetical protein